MASLRPCAAFCLPPHLYFADRSSIPLKCQEPRSGIIAQLPYMRACIAAVKRREDPPLPTAWCPTADSLSVSTSAMDSGSSSTLSALLDSFSMPSPSSPATVSSFDQQPAETYVVWFADENCSERGAFKIVEWPSEPAQAPPSPVLPLPCLPPPPPTPDTMAPMGNPPHFSALLEFIPTSDSPLPSNVGDKLAAELSERPMCDFDEALADGWVVLFAANDDTTLEMENKSASRDFFAVFASDTIFRFPLAPLNAG